jgi:hypothetical protein
VKVWLAPAATVTWDGETASAAVATLTVTVAVAVWLAESVTRTTSVTPPVAPAV